MVNITMKTRDGHAFANGIYTKNATTVKAGGKICKEFHGIESVQKIRCNPDIVDEEGNILKDVTFRSPSTAAQFVNGNISNGLRVWKVNGINLGKYLKDEM